MPNNVKWGILFALERDLEHYLKFAKERPKGWLESADADDWKGDARNLVAALNHMIPQISGYINMGHIRRDLELLRVQVE